MTERALIAALAQELAAFRTTRRGGRLHIGRDMSLCSFRAAPSPLAHACSPRCQRVAVLLTEADAYLAQPTLALEYAE